MNKQMKRGILLVAASLITATAAQAGERYNPYSYGSPTLYYSPESTATRQYIEAEKREIDRYYRQEEAYIRQDVARERQEQTREAFRFDDIE